MHIALMPTAISSNLWSKKNPAAGNRMVVRVLCDDVPVCHKEMRTSQLRGVKRIEEKRALKHMTPKACEAEQLLVAKDSSDALLEGNILGVKSVDEYRQRYRKARSEALSEFDLDQNPFKDLFLLQESKCDKKYGNAQIQSVGRPLHVYVFSLEQLSVVKQVGARRAKLPTLYSDATGNFVEKMLYERKQVLYYACVIDIDNIIFPVLEMITNQHFSGHVAAFCISYCHYAEKHANEWPLFSGVVFDFLFAIINGVCLAFNHMDLSEYFCHQKMLKLNALAPLNQKVILCTNLFSKAVKNSVKCSQVHTKFIARRIKINNFDFNDIQANALVICKAFDTTYNNCTLPMLIKDREKM